MLNTSSMKRFLKCYLAIFHASNRDIFAIKKLIISSQETL